jgi:prepilin-type processing-associated H-X9-DG protein
LTLAIIVWLFIRALKKSSVLHFLGAAIPIACLVLLCLPKIQGAKEAARRSQCRANLRDLGVALRRWEVEKGRLPDPITKHTESPPTSWRVALLSLLGKAALSDRYDPKLTWDAPPNIKVSQTNPEIYVCPTNFNSKDQDGRYFTAYLLVTGPQTAFPNGAGIELEEITDGLAHTLLLGEAAGLNVVWTEPRDIDVATQPIGINLDGQHETDSPALFSSYHAFGAQVLFADGRVRYLSQDIDPAVLRALTTSSAGDSVKGQY